MAEDLQEEDFSGQDQRLKLVIFGLFFAGLFLLAIGAGIFLFRSSSSVSDEIEIISASQGVALQGQRIVVHVDGAVAKPGVYELPSDSRISDAVSVAGNLAQDADTAKVNLAAKVSDGQKIYIPKIGEQSAGGSQTVAGDSTSALININTATESQLDTLPGVGPVTAQKIIASRPYSSPEELLTRKAVGQSVYEKIRDLITVY